jgi:hypothetical protein
MVTRFFGNPLLRGRARRGSKHSVKRFRDGKRISQSNPEGPKYWSCDHLAHLDAVELDEVNRLLRERNLRYRRSESREQDPLLEVPRKRTRFPGPHATCWYCGHHYVWGGNGITENLMCSGSRAWACWNSVGFNGALAAKRVVSAIMEALLSLEDIDAEFRARIQEASRGKADDASRHLVSLRIEEESVRREKTNIVAALAAYGPKPMFIEKIAELEAREKELAARRERCMSTPPRDLCLPESPASLRKLVKGEFQRLAVTSSEVCDLLRELVPEFHVYLVRMCDGGLPLPRARVRLNLGGSIRDLARVPGLEAALSRTLTLDLFEPPTREKIRLQAVRLQAEGLPLWEIASPATISRLDKRSPDRIMLRLLVSCTPKR